MSHLIVPGLAFAIASSPATYKLTRKVAGNWVSNFEGVATPAGLFLHTLFFLFILYLVGKVMPRLSMASELMKDKVEYQNKMAYQDKMAYQNKIAAVAKPVSPMCKLFGFGC